MPEGKIKANIIKCLPITNVGGFIVAGTVIILNSAIFGMSIYDAKLLSAWLHISNCVTTYISTHTVATRNVIEYMSSHKYTQEDIAVMANVVTCNIAIYVIGISLLPICTLVECLTNRAQIRGRLTEEMNASNTSPDVIILWCLIIFIISAWMILSGALYTEHVFGPNVMNNSYLFIIVSAIVIYPSCLSLPSLLIAALNYDCFERSKAGLK